MLLRKTRLVLLIREKSWNDIVKQNDLWLQYEGIRFKAENMDKGTIEGEEQWVQILDETYDRTYDKGKIIQSISAALDGCYPYQSGSKAMDAPAMILETGKERLQLPTEDGEIVDLTASKKTQVNSMYLMFRPALAESEWVPIKIIHWTWAC